MRPVRTKPVCYCDSASLTEAVTWIVYGRRYTDKEWSETQSQIARENFEKWGSVEGPHAVLPYQEILSGGHECKDEPEALPNVRRLVAKSGSDAVTSVPKMMLRWAFGRYGFSYQFQR